MFRGLSFFLKNGWKYDKRYVLWGSLQQIVGGLAQVTAVVLPKFLLDELLGQGRPMYIALWALALAGSAAVAVAANAFLLYDGFTRRCRVNSAFDAELHERLANADLCDLESPAFQDMQRKAVKFLYCDWHGFGYLLDYALGIVGQMIALAGIAAVLAALHPLLLALLAGSAYLAYLAQKRAKKRAVELNLRITEDQRRRTYFCSLFEQTQYAKEVRLDGAKRWLLERERHFMTSTDNALAESNSAYMCAGFVGALSGFLQQGAICAYLAVKALRGGLTAGDFTMQLSAVTAFTASMHGALERIAEIRAYDMYYDALDDYLNMPARLLGGKRLPVPQGERCIQFEHVSFRYPGQTADALTDVNLTIRPGVRLMIVGENGAGKSTLIKLLCKLYAPTSGRILLDGVDIADIDTEEYWSLFATVFQDFRLFALPLRENLTLGKDVADETLTAILHDVGFGSKLSKLEQGLDTYIGRDFSEEGFLPSGGEAQKLALARALVKAAPIAILDEPTAALDPRSEQEMFQNFVQLVRGKTTVFISHRLSAAKICDEIAVFAKSRLVEHGTHAELLQKRGLYAELYEMQAQNYRD